MATTHRGRFAHVVVAERSNRLELTATTTRLPAMPAFTRDDVTIEYQVAGNGHEPPVLLISPGGMDSTIARWSTAPWNPIEALPGFLRVAMDQRNSGQSRARVQPGDGWASYTADQLALLDHLGIDKVQVIGQCIGGPYIFGLIKAAPERIQSAVLMQPIGLENNRNLFYDLFDQWSAAMAGTHPEADADTWRAFREAMFGGDFMFNTTRDDVAACETPLLVLMGNDPYHPASVSKEIVKLARNATLVEQWRDPPHTAPAIEVVAAFLRQHA